MERSKMYGVLLFSILVVGLVGESSAFEFHESKITWPKIDWGKYVPRSLFKICYQKCLKKGRSKLDCTTYCLGHIEYTYQNLHGKSKKGCFDAQISSN
ncbi:hypothetical protein AMTRI_Chr03g140130 [Amborella trichopoda]